MCCCDVDCLHGIARMTVIKGYDERNRTECCVSEPIQNSKTKKGEPKLHIANTRCVWQ